MFTKDSITRSPEKFAAFSAAMTFFQSTLPEPGTPRSLSLKCT